ncbi:site-specific integrase [Streptococcus gallolyticus subsp. gallolyticus]|uniref:tyrosine-type recombinase/integrase n=1 Tax=Streptococcus gallolyticus TaxID=315405 RepID=UPI002000C651|nr:tyrosine-type recombinase/integrase [Streptococcus gallolyticus]MCY7156198.1 site-specific integrase [Streptococcus gallolyticus subsp. gallolyticus]MCY7174700.1 site-specific integrase [Streptococcus gallolyticus subsp. gallolyticus]MCY7176687.1 site-specific integrase [Streptococcus gallolyticus subsp. gallolyticus]MCY7181633.1 site-specific integrase [Streptococcus gallolyticus subsp. gallolyticus]MCY7198864.1 site-specific integrase [Streptococcus gallolyticus subsp. gallolyticus]
MVVKKNGNNGWLVDVSNGFNPVTLKQRRIIRKGFKTKKEALEAEQYLRSVELKERYFGAKITMDMLYAFLREEDIINHRKQSYINTQENNYNRHIKHYFEKVTDVSKLQYDDFYDFREHLIGTISKNTKKTLSPNTINKIMILLKKIMDIGVRKGFYPSNPVTLIKKLPIDKPKLNYWTVSEFKDFLELFTPEEYHYQLLFKVLYFTGMRLGEVLALNWNDIDFSRNTIAVSKSVYFKKGVSYISTPKTKASIRQIVINAKLMNELEVWQHKQYELLRQFSNDDCSDLQLFQNSPIPITKDSIEKYYRGLLKRNPKLKKIRIHDLRHSHASLLINQGEDYLVVKERLGHASITTTIDTYSHLYPSKQVALADKLDSLF